jgi:dCMP deaminase
MDKNQLKWDIRFLKLADFIANWSKDPSTKVGAVITRGNQIVSVGYNGLPKGVKDTPERLNNRDIKIECTVHCERNAIIFAKQDISNCTMYTYPLGSCGPCAGMVIASGIKRVVYPKIKDANLLGRWDESLRLGREMFAEAGVEMLEIDLDNDENLV